jgi:hypothetical protein
MTVATLTRYGVQLRARIDGDTLHGHAAVFGQMARVPEGWESLKPSAFNEVLARTDCDVRALRDHDPKMLLGRQSSGTLRLDVDDEGLAFDVDLPDTSYAHDLRVLVDRGDLTGGSFGFIPGRHEDTKAPDGRKHRSHTSLSRLVDVSSVTFPAYDGAAVALRSVDFTAVPSNRSQLILARHRAHTRSTRP